LPKITQPGVNNVRAKCAYRLQLDVLGFKALIELPVALIAALNVFGFCHNFRRLQKCNLYHCIRRFTMHRTVNIVSRILMTFARLSRANLSVSRLVFTVLSDAWRLSWCTAPIVHSRPAVVGVQFRSSSSACYRLHAFARLADCLSTAWPIPWTDCSTDV